MFVLPSVTPAQNCHSPVATSPIVERRCPCAVVNPTLNSICCKPGVASSHRFKTAVEATPHLSMWTMCRKIASEDRLMMQPTVIAPAGIV